MYRVIPFVANVANLQRGQGGAVAAQQLEELINQNAAQGWHYVGFEKVETWVNGSSGCFGLGATAGHMTFYSLVIFRR